MEEELAQLRDLITQLQAENQQMRRERDADQPGPSTSSGPAPGLLSTPVPVAERLIYLPRDRKCPLFRGRTGLSIGEWIEEVYACIRARHLSPADQALFIYDHLEGEARAEIKYRSPAERADPDRILLILKELYGCTKSYVSLQEDFFSRKQQDGETLQEFSHALMCLMERVVQKSPPNSFNSEVLLRDQFVEHVSDCSLRRELKQFVRGHPTATLIDVRTEAIRWEQEGMPGGARGRSYSVPNAFGYQHTIPGTRSNHQGTGNSSFSSELNELKELLRNQQEQLTHLTKSLAALKEGPRIQSGHGKRTVICRRCQKPGHFARECREDYAAIQPQLAPVATQCNPDKYSPQTQGNLHPLNH